jgi:UDPglucose 6-dehydrogenase
MFKIGIVGYGYVGKGMHKFLGDWVRAIYDPFCEDDDGTFLVDREKEDFKDLDLVIVSVPTNTSKDGMTGDFSIVEDSVKWLTELNLNLLIMVKSAVVPSEADRIQKKYKARLVVSPEYLGEGNYFVPFWKYPHPTEMKMHSFQVFGGEPKDTSACIDIFIKKMGPHVQFHQVDLKTAALCKYMENSWGAMKVTFCNEWYDIAKAHGVDYNTLREIWAADERVERMHTAVFPKARGYGGKCFPKDIKAIIVDTEKAGYKPSIMRCVDKTNEELTKKNKK